MDSIEVVIAANFFPKRLKRDGMRMAWMHTAGRISDWTYMSGHQSAAEGGEH
jgi:hypothetical protein